MNIRISNTITFVRRNAGWWLIGLLTAIVVIRWFQIVPASSLNDSGYSFFSGIGRLTALVGIILYSLNFVLSTRLRFLDLLFGGLNRAYIAHHLVGGLALIFILVHPLALAMRFVPDQMYEAATFLLPLLGDSADAAINFGFIAFIGMVVLLVLTFFVKLPYQLWLFSHKFLGPAFAFAGLHVFFISSDVSNDNFMRYYVLGFAALGLAAYIYRTLLGNILVRRDEYLVESVETLVNGIFKIKMRPKKRVINYKPGQFVFIKFVQEGMDDEVHPFSISSAPGRDLEIVVKTLGDYTADLIELRPNATAVVEGAYGRFTYTNYSRPKQIWVAGGIGVTPFLSMAASLEKHRDKEYEVHMFYAVKSASELVDEKQLKKIAGSADLNFHYHPFVGDLEKAYISADYIADKTEGILDADVFICGPPGMMKSLKEQFVEKGLPKKNIHTEEFAIL